MTQEQLNFTILHLSKYLPASSLPMVRQRLEKIPDNQVNLISSFELKDPTTTLIISIFAGSLGIDRFYIGDTGKGIAKLLTAGGCGIWTIIDWFLIQDETRQKNLESLLNQLSLSGL